MANIKIGNPKVIGNRAPHTATSYQFAKDKDFKQIIDESLENKIDKFQWHSPLVVDGTKQCTMTKVYARYKLHFDTQESEWITFEVENQMTQAIKYINENGTIESYTEGQIVINK